MGHHGGKETFQRCVLGVRISEGSAFECAAGRELTARGARAVEAGHGIDSCLGNNSMHGHFPALSLLRSMNFSRLF